MTGDDLPAVLVEVLEELRRASETTAPELAAALGVTTKDADNALRRLRERGLAVNQKRGGTLHAFWSPAPSQRARRVASIWEYAARIGAD